MAISRLLETVHLLLARRMTTAKELAAHFEVSTRTIYRDIETLSGAGIPVYASPGKGGGIALLDDYVLSRSLLSDKEQNEILLALQTLGAAHYPGAASVLDKLSSLFRKSELSWIEVDFAPWGSDLDYNSRFKLLQEAILDQRLLEFDYYNSAGERGRRRVEPMKLLFKSRGWYLQGFCLSAQGPRLFKISRMAELTATGAHFASRPAELFAYDVSPAAFEPLITLKLAVAAQGAYRVYDEFPPGDVERLADGSFRVTTQLPDGEWLIGYLLSFGVMAEVLEPAGLRETLADRLDAMRGNYS
ncbi:YafY family transcriptional regulator [Paenibacillus athensensis]|uniref:Transcriptional regulator n=1 Tax=Paenibacillus athensensis TaxID=1967502 RepID=A0A4Y8Q867_9BACL|nr:YafY family protein [Paenibacillus athensensis]MCD1260338.1 YafY family transcriptional regulator [Paenibacillus athensensis]